VNVRVSRWSWQFLLISCPKASTHITFAHTSTALLADVRGLEYARAVRRAGLASKVERNDEVDVVVQRLLSSSADGLVRAGIERMLGKDTRVVLEMARKEGAGREEDDEENWREAYEKV
jgi:hypothetical protein